MICCHGSRDATNWSLRSMFACISEYFMVKQFLENIGEGLLHPYISSKHACFFDTLLKV
jgi:hypothetical protein